MAQEMVTIPKKEYEELLEEVGILRNPDMREAVRESDETKKRGPRPGNCPSSRTLLGVNLLQQQQSLDVPRQFHRPI